MSDIKEYNSIMKKIGERQFSPIYMLDGDEPFFVDSIANRLENDVLSESEASFNKHILYGRDVKVNDLIGTCKRYPMMADYQLVLVREAQYLKDIESLLSYAENPTNSTILVVLYKGKTINRNTKLGRALKKYVHYSSQKLWDNQVLPWLNDYLKIMGVRMEAQAKDLLIETNGTYLDRIDGELQKLMANIGERNTITVEDLESQSGISKDYNVFELSRSLGERNFSRSIEIGDVIGRDKKNTPMQMLLPVVFNYFKRLEIIHELAGASRSELASKVGVSPYRIDEYVNAARNYSHIALKHIFQVIHEIDLRVKGIAEERSNDRELLRELIVRIIS